MPINGNQNLNPNDTCYSLPVDTMYVGNGGPTPQEAAKISKSVSSPATSKNVQAHNTGYDGP